MQTESHLETPEQVHQASSSQQQQLCVFVRDLDSGVASCVSPENINQNVVLSTPRKGSNWEDYWQERESNKQMLMKMVNGGRADRLAQVLLAKKKEIDLNQYIYLDGWTLLHHAVDKKSAQMTEILINNGCDVNKQTESMHRTPLHLAILRQAQEIISILLFSHANPNLVDIDFCSPLHYAAQFGYVDVARTLLSCCDAKIDFALRNNRKMTALDCCRDYRIREMLKDYCEEHGLDLQGGFYESRTVDIQALENQEKVNYLVRSRSDLVEKILDSHAKIQSKLAQINCVITNSCKVFRPLGTRSKRENLHAAMFLAKRSLLSYKQTLASQNPQSLQNYDIIKKIGSGSFGTVFLIRRKHSSNLFALKRLNKQYLIANKLKKYAYAQRQILKVIKHPFILHASSFFQDRNFLYMVMDFCAGGDLEKHVRKQVFAEEKARKYCCEVVLALEQLHKNNYLFRDLKLSNVLVDETGHVKLADFGLAKKTEISHSFLGSVAYLAPEMLVDTDNKPHTACMDWYLLGVFLYEMLTGLPPFYNTNRMIIFQQIKKSKPKIPENLSPECKDFLRRTLHKVPQERLGAKGASEIKSHAFFGGINWAGVMNKQLPMEIPQINHKELRIREYIEEGSAVDEDKDQNTFHGWDFNAAQL